MPEKRTRRIDSLTFKRRGRVKTPSLYRHANRPVEHPRQGAEKSAQRPFRIGTRRLAVGTNKAARGSNFVVRDETIAASPSSSIIHRGQGPGGLTGQAPIDDSRRRQ